MPANIATAVVALGFSFTAFAVRSTGSAKKHSHKAAAEAAEPVWADLAPDEFVFVRHGESEWNAGLHDFKVAWADSKSKLCSDKDALTGDDAEICTKMHVNDAATKFARSGAHSPLKRSASNLLASRDAVYDAPLTPDGLTGAKQFHENLKKQELPESWTSGPILLASNLARAADTLVNSFEDFVPEAAESHKLFIESSMQEFSQSGNTDAVSVLLPTVINTQKTGGFALFSNTERVREENYNRNGMEKPWKDIMWWSKNARTITGEKLYNHDKLCPNEKLATSENLQRIVPDEISNFTTVLKTDYNAPKSRIPVGGPDGWTDRYSNFNIALGSLKKDFPGKAVLSAGHSNWFKSYVGYLLDQGILSDESCIPFANTVINNIAMVRITQEGKCRCLYSGQVTMQFFDLKNDQDQTVEEASMCLAKKH